MRKLSLFPDLGALHAAVAASALELTAEQLPDATIDGAASGTDTLALIGGGIFDLTLPAMLTGIATVRGSAEHDTIVVDEARFAGIGTFDGGEKAATTWNELILQGDAFDLTAKTFIGISRISLAKDDPVLTVTGTDKAAKALALRAGGVASQNDTLVALGLTFESADLKALHRQGIDTVIDAAGSHTNLAPMATNLHGDHIDAGAGQVVFVDKGGNATLSDDDPALSLLAVEAPKGLSAPGRLGIDGSGSVALSLGYKPGSVVKVGGTEVGMLWDASDVGLRIAFGPNATPALVQEIVRALTYTMADEVPEATTLQNIAVTLVDEGGRKAVSTITIEQTVKVEPPQLLLSRASVAELAQDGTLVGLLTAKVTGEGDGFAYELLDDADHRFAIQGDRLVVRSGLKLDYEQQSSHSVTIRAVKGDIVVEQTFNITIQDVVDEVVIGTGGIGTPKGGDGTGMGSGANRNLVLIGGKGRDKLVGGEGNDKLYGRGGKDVLKGGEGSDIFVFDTKPSKTNIDTILDFNPKYDTIWLDKKVFKGLGKKGTPDKPFQLTKKMFVKGVSAKDAGDHLIYDSRKGVLWYDSDGTGATAVIQIAILPKNLKSFSDEAFYAI